MMIRNFVLAGQHDLQRSDHFHIARAIGGFVKIAENRGYEAFRSS